EDLGHQAWDGRYAGGAAYRNDLTDVPGVDPGVLERLAARQDRPLHDDTDQALEVRSCDRRARVPSDLEQVEHDLRALRGRQVPLRALGGRPRAGAHRRLRGELARQLGQHDFGEPTVEVVA